ncbi:myelin-associated glycoprotein-like isoform X2 [Trachinotus anak]|uniref:myelin-associated glycoprotein-like isoform X2 n=1 Tax=Trachinotus anak TaxID=443729 RepID=UPI0039F1BBCD
MSLSIRVSSSVSCILLSHSSPKITLVVFYNTFYPSPLLTPQGITALQHVKSWSINVPTTIHAVEGSCVVVPCQTQPHSWVTWYQYHTLSYPVVYDKLNPDAVKDQFRGRTSVPGNAAEGNCTLVINNVRGDDNNLRVYVWIHPDLTKQKFYDQTVTIIVERHAPIISVQKQIVDEEFFHANCSIICSCPFSPPPLHWSISSFLKNSSLMAFSQKVQGQWLYTEMMHGLATYEMHKSTMRCSAQFTTLTTESQQITLSILYKPVTVTLIPEKETVMEHGSIMIECTVNSNPRPHVYSWLRRQMDQLSEINSTQRRMFFSNITRDTSLSCIAHNEVGLGKSNWLHLNVQHAPVILPESSCHLTGEVLQCVCQARASPNAFIYLTIDGNNSLPSFFNVVFTNKTNVVSGEISGLAEVQTIVTCTAWNSLGNDTKQLSISSLSCR